MKLEKVEETTEGVRAAFREVCSWKTVKKKSTVEKLVGLYVFEVCFER